MKKIKENLEKKPCDKDSEAKLHKALLEGLNEIGKNR